MGVVKSRLGAAHCHSLRTAGLSRYLVSVPDNGDSRWSRYGLPAL